MQAECVLEIGSTNLVWLRRLKNSLTGAVVTSATVVCDKVEDAAGNTVTGSTNIAMDYQAGASLEGSYAGNLPDTAAALLTEDAEYTVFVTATVGDLVKRFERKARAAYGNA